MPRILPTRRLRGWGADARRWNFLFLKRPGTQVWAVATRAETISDSEISATEFEGLASGQPTPRDPLSCRLTADRIGPRFDQLREAATTRQRGWRSLPRRLTSGCGCSGSKSPRLHAGPRELLVRITLATPSGTDEKRIESSRIAAGDASPLRVWPVFSKAKRCLAGPPRSP